MEVMVFYRITDQEGMGEMRQEIRGPHMVHVMWEVLGKDRFLFGTGLHVRPDRFQCQPRRCHLARPETVPERVFP